MIYDMTKEKPLKAIVRMSLSVMAGNLFQQFYGMADAVIVGRILGENSLAAVGSTSSLYYLVLWFVTGVASGFTVLIAQRFGAQDYEKMRDRLCQAIVLSAVITLVATLAALLFIRRLLVVMNTPAEILEDACRYIVVILGGLAATMLYNLSAAVLRALGDSRTPLYFLVLTSLLNVVLDILFIRWLYPGTAGAAWATVISQAVSGILCVCYMWKKFPILHMKRRNWRFGWWEAKQMLGMGIPLGIQGSVTASGVIVLQFAINSFGTTAVAAYTAATKVEQVVSQPLAAYSVTMVNYVGQNYGAGKYANIRKGVWQCFWLAIATAAAGGVILICFGGQLAGLFLDSSSVEVLAYAKEYLGIVGGFLASFGTLCMLRSSIQGMGDAKVPLLNGIVESTSRILWTVYLIHYGDFHQLCYANPATWTLAALILVILYRRKVHKIEGELKS